MIPEPPAIRDLAMLEPALRSFVANLTVRWEVETGISLKPIETLRTAERHAWLWQHGRGPDADLRARSKRTWVKTSRHQVNDRGLSEAVDLAIVRASGWVWARTSEELDLYRQLIAIGKTVAKEMGIEVRNLGDDTGSDWFHWELMR